MSTPYRLTGRIEAGDLADLCKGTQDAAGDVVVKLFHPKTSDPAYARALAETSRVLNPLGHEGIVHYVDLGFVKQRLAVVREHVDGYTLGTALQRLNTKEVLLPAPIALYLIIQLLETVQKAHEAGVIHGAITPGNVLLSREGQPSICDFGALKALMAVPELKRTFATRGRSAYRAPEVSRGEEPTEVSDVYSLGSITYELLTLREAVVANGGVSTRSGGLPPPSRIDRRINSRLDPIILRALDPFPNRRFRSAGELAGALRNFLAASGGMPGQEDLRRFVRELVPNEVSLSTLGPAPFTEPFTLTPISGAEIADLHAEVPEHSVVARPSFSRSLSEEEAIAVTTEAAPVFEEYKPEAWSPLEPTRAGQPEPVAEKENTEPSHVGPLEQGWEAPPGAAPPRPRKQLVPLGGITDSREGTRVGRNPRFKYVEDFSEEETRIADDLPRDTKEADPPPPAKASPARPAPAPGPKGEKGERLPPSLLRDKPAPPEPTGIYVPRDRPEIPMPPPTDEGLKAVVAEKRLFTEERNLRAIALRRNQALGVATAIFLVGIFAFAVAVWTKPPSKPEVVDPRATAISQAVDQYVAPGSQPKPEPSKPPAATQDPREDPATKDPKPDPNSAFVTIRSSIPARVFIDGTSLNRRTPLLKYPVKPGNRIIVLEAVETKQRKEIRQRFERGEHRSFVENFDPPPRR
jgi:serine/threonine protein kinase